MTDKPSSDHWLVRPETIVLLWKILIAVLASTMLRGGGLQRWRDALRHGRVSLPRSLTGDRK